MKNPFDISGKVVVVTGAAGYLGQGYVRTLTELGARVIAWDQHGEKMDAAFKDVPSGVELRVIDITKEEEVARAVEEIVKKYGRIDGLINNAAMNPWPGDPDADKQFVPYEEYPIALFRKEIDINLTGMMITTKHIALVMIKQRSGSIINIASDVSVTAHDHRVYAQEGRYKSPAYTASKAGIVGLTRQWAARLGTEGVRINALSPGGVHNPAMPAEFMRRLSRATMLGRMANPGEYDATLVYLLSDASSFMTGSNLILDGGKHAW